MADTVDVQGAQRVLYDLGPSVEQEWNQAQAQHLADLAASGAAGAYALGGSAVYVAPTIRPSGYDLLVGGGGTTSGGGTVGDVLLGTMFGSSVYPQFPGRNADGYYLTDEIEALAAGDDPYGTRDSDALGAAIRKAG